MSPTYAMSAHSRRFNNPLTGQGWTPELRRRCCGIFSCTYPINSLVSSIHDDTTTTSTLPVGDIL
jgi:hypothetical protein